MIREITMNAMNSRIGSAPASGLPPPPAGRTGRALVSAVSLTPNPRAMMLGQRLDPGLQRAGVVLPRQPLAHEIADPARRRRR